MSRDDLQSFACFLIRRHKSFESDRTEFSPTLEGSFKSGTPSHIWLSFHHYVNNNSFYMLSYVFSFFTDTINISSDNFFYCKNGPNLIILHFFIIDNLSYARLLGNTSYMCKSHEKL